MNVHVMYMYKICTGFIGEGDNIQLIKFRPSCAPGRESAAGANFFCSALLQPARSVCVSLSAFFIVYDIHVLPIGVIEKEKMKEFYSPQLSQQTKYAH